PDGLNRRSAGRGTIRCVRPDDTALPVTITSAMLTYFVFMLQKCLERRKDRASSSCRISDQPPEGSPVTNPYRVFPVDAKYWNGRGKCAITPAEGSPERGEGGNHGCSIL